MCVAPFPTPRCSSYRKGSLRVTLDEGRQLTFLLVYVCVCICMYVYECVDVCLKLNFYLNLNILNSTFTYIWKF